MFAMCVPVTEKRFILPEGQNFISAVQNMKWSEKKSLPIGGRLNDGTCNIINN